MEKSIAVGTKNLKNKETSYSCYAFFKNEKKKTKEQPSAALTMNAE